MRFVAMAVIMLMLGTPAWAYDKATQRVQTLVLKLPINNWIYYLPPTKRSDLVCVALAIYKEARSLSEQGKFLVAKTIYNRSQERDKSYCAVISEHSQFPWVSKLAKNWLPNEMEAWQDALSVAIRSSLNLYKEPNCRIRFFNTVLLPEHKQLLRCSIVVTKHIYYDLRNN